MPSDTSKKKTATKKLFIVSPIGDPRSEDRIYFDKVKRHIIDPIATEKGYETTRADDISRPGRITKQIIERLRVDDLVVADLTRKNPNVFYELAVRHAVGKPVILMAGIDEKIPFDVAAQRVIFYDLDPDNIEKAKAELMRQISAVESATFIVDSPIEVPISLERTEKSGNEELQEIIAILRNQSMRLDGLEEFLRPRKKPRRVVSPPPQNGHRMASIAYGIAKNSLKLSKYELVSSDWSKTVLDSGITEGDIHDSYGTFHANIESRKPRPKIHYDDENMVVWIIEPRSDSRYRRFVAYSLNPELP